MAEIEIGLFQRGCLNRRLGDEAALQRQVAALETERNAQRRTITWCFTSQDARIKRQRLYPIKQT
jgi:hypothetical protein